MDVEIDDDDERRVLLRSSSALSIIDKSIIDACTWWLTWNKQCFRTSGIDEAMCYSKFVRVLMKEQNTFLSLSLLFYWKNDWRWRLIRTMTIETCPKQKEDTSIFWTNSHSIFSRCSYLILCVYDVSKYNVYKVYRQICTLFSPPLSLYYVRKKIDTYIYVCVISIRKTKKIIGSRNDDTNKW